MPHQIGYVTDQTMLAHYAMLDVVRTACLAAGWQVLRYDTANANRELILKAPGYTGEEEIFVGLRTYQNAAADYYNLVAAAFVGYVPGNTFDTQPDAILSGVPAHNRRIDYWLTINPQRLALAMKVGTPVYESLYLGKMLPYARPSQYPYPVVCGGMLNGAPPTRFSDLNHSVYTKGARANMRLRFNDGQWLQPQCWPWSNDFIPKNPVALRDTDGHYPLLPVVLHDATRGVIGELDGIYHITGFNNTVESTLNVGGKQHVVIQDNHRTSFGDYYAMRMDT